VLSFWQKDSWKTPLSKMILLLDIND